MTDIIQLSMFDDQESSKKQNKKQTEQSNIKTKYFKYTDEILEFLSKGHRSALEISNLLISEKGLKDERFITEKPHVYIDVCLFLDSLVESKQYKLVESKNDYSDRIYQKI